VRREVRQQPSEIAMSKIFLNYRRRDSAGHTGRLYDWLTKYFGQREVFFDINDLRVGNFEKSILNELKSCRVFIPVIGKQWPSLFDMSQSTTDFVHKEIDFILSKNREVDPSFVWSSVLVLPILVDNAAVPEEDKTPPDLRELLKQQMTVIDDRDFSGSVEKLIEKIEAGSQVRRLNHAEDVHTNCVKCNADRIHKQSAPTEDNFSHIRPDAEFDPYDPNEQYLNRSWTNFERVRIRHCKGCGTPHLFQQRWTSESDTDNPGSNQRFEMNFNAYKKPKGC
jgi:hypothetical protein